MYGRGYRISGSLEAKVQLKLMSNSAAGYNAGELRVQFRNGDYRVKFGSGELSGLITGDRKLNMTGKIVIYEQEQGLLC
jgi:hypothetical protein